MTEESNGSATSAEAGTNSTSSAPPSNAPEAEAVGASTAAASAEPTARATPLVLDGWSCESFEWKTGHAIGRSATHLGSDFQLMRVVVTAGETGDSDPEQVPESVLSWLMRKEKP